MSAATHSVSADAKPWAVFTVLDEAGTKLHIQMVVDTGAANIKLNRNNYWPDYNPTHFDRWPGDESIRWGNSMNITLPDPYYIAPYVPPVAPEKAPLTKKIGLRQP